MQLEETAEKHGVKLNTLEMGLDEDQAHNEDKFASTLQSIIILHMLNIRNP